MRTHQHLIIWALALMLISCAPRSSEILLPPVDNDKAIGRQMARQVEQTMGHYDQGELTAYVSRIMQRLAAQHEDQRFDYQIDIVDQAGANAFATPGGHIYISRGLLALTRNEAELAHVLGHEIIHVSRRHLARRLARSRVPKLLSMPGLVVGGMLSERLGNLMNAPIYLAGGAMISKHSREAEYESDRLGQALAAKAGYDPGALPVILNRMAAADRAKTGKTRKVSFFDTHPTAPDRTVRLQESARSMDWSPLAHIAGSRLAYLKRLDGLLVDENPADGIFKGQQFLHPVMDFSVTFPEGWKALNTPNAVVGIAPEKEAAILLSLAGQGISAREKAAGIRALLREEHGITPTQDRPVTLAGLPGNLMTLTDTTGREPMHLHCLWFEYKDKLYRFKGMGSDRYRPLLKAAALSFRPLTPAEKSGIKEQRLRVVAARKHETLEELSRRSGNVWSPAYTAVANGADVGQPLAAGTLIKVAVEKTFNWRKTNSVMAHYFIYGRLIPKTSCHWVRTHE